MLISYEGRYKDIDRDAGRNNVRNGFNNYVDDFLNTFDTLANGQNNDELTEHNSPMSDTLQEFEWTDTLVIKIFELAEILTIQQQPDINVTMYGNSDLTIFLVENNIMNEFRLMINSIILGSGKILSQDITYG